MRLTGHQPLARAISTAGGISFAPLDDTLMLKAISGTHAIGDILGWETLTGGYLLQACFLTAMFAARGVIVGMAAGNNGRVLSVAV